LVRRTRPDPTTIVIGVLLVVAIVLAAAFEAPIWAYLMISGIALLTIAVSALLNPVLFKIGARSIARRGGMSLIVIAGLMIGTVIISSSFVIGDTMDRMITRVHYDMYHEVDGIVYANGLEEEKAAIPQDQAEAIKDSILKIEHVEGATLCLDTRVFVMDETSGQTEPAIGLVGYETSSIEFGSFHSGGRDLPMVLGPSEVYIDRGTADALDASVGDVLSIYTVTGQEPVTVKAIVDDSGRAYWRGDCIFMPLENAQSLLGLPGKVNTILVTNEGGVRGGERYCDGVSDAIEGVLEGNALGLELMSDKHGEVEQGRKEMKQFTQMFLVFGSFSVIAGMILIINIFVMLGEERKGEMGISRAVGMTRDDLKRTFVYEGGIYSAISSMIGALLGIGVAYMVLLGMQSIFGMWFDGASIMDSFHFRPQSLVYAFTFGMLISLVTVSFAASRINRLNIVRAIRNIPEPKVPLNSNRAMFAGSVMLFVGMMLAVAGLFAFDEIGLEAYEMSGIYTGGSVALIGAALLARRLVGDRASFSVVSVLLIVFWMVPAKVLGLDSYGAGMEMFILSGVFAVSAGIVLFIYNSDLIITVLSRLWSFTGRPTASLKTASSYPMKNTFRTGMTIYMFALIVFTITVMSMMIGVLSVNIERITYEQMGRVEVVGIGSPFHRIEDIQHEIEMCHDISAGDFDAVYSLSSGNVVLDRGRPSAEGNETMTWTLFGVDGNIRRTGWTFKERMDGLYSDEDVWDSLEADGSLAVVDATFSEADDEWDDGIDQFAVRAGEKVKVITPYGDKEVTIAAVMEQSLLQGVFVSRTSASSDLGLNGTNFFLFDLTSGPDENEVAKGLERELGLQTIVLSEQVEMVTRSMEQMFDLFSAFMGLGLVVGIAGLGIITLRAVHERRAEIGMMRAIGFQKLSVTWSFLMEAGFIATSGILLGSLLGMALGYTLWYDEFRPMDFDFTVPWMKILLVGAVSLLATLMFTVPPSLSASSVAPAEALRYD